MPSFDLVVSTKVKHTPRVQQVSGLFDVPLSEKLSDSWKGELPLDERDWSIGLIVGPSGSGKSQIARHLWGDKVDTVFDWGDGALVDAFGKEHSITKISEALGYVGLNSIPSWLKPYYVLSMGEQFRATCARALLESGDLIVMDEFTSVIDRTVAKATSHAMQKIIRKSGKRLIAIGCHYDVEPWLNPDWVFEPATCEFKWRRLRPRPEIKIEIKRVEYKMWQNFSKYHYMSAALNRSAKLFCGFIDQRPAVIGCILPRPVSRGKNKGTALYGVSRLVTHPDFQGVGVGMQFITTIGALYSASGRRFRMYPAHKALINAFRRSSKWEPVTDSGNRRSIASTKKSMGGRRNSVFEYVGKPFNNKTVAREIIKEKI